MPCKHPAAALCMHRSDVQYQPLTQARLLGLVLLQTRGAVRDTVKLSQAAFWFKVYVAAAAAAAEQARELQLLNTALGFMNRSMIDALPAVWAEADVNQAYRDAFDAQQMLNASCLCPNMTSLLTGTIGYTDSATYLASKCTGVLCATAPAGYSSISSSFPVHGWCLPYAAPPASSA